jgi:hypothetical protein
MKLLKLFCLFTFTNLMVYPLHANSDFIIPNAKLEIKTDHALDKFQEMTLNVEDILLNYSPEGAEITNLKVNRNEIEFNAKKRILFVSKTIMVRGTVNIEAKDLICPRTDKGFIANMDFSGSDDIIYNNFENLNLVICVREINSNYLQANVSGTIIASENYGSLTGSIVKDVLLAQVQPILTAIKTVVLKKP